MISKIIKHEPKPSEPAKADFFENSGGVVHKRVIDAKDLAAKIIEDARSGAEKIRKEANSIREEAKVHAAESVKKGYADGESKGLSAVTEKLMLVEKLKETFFVNAEPEVIKLSMSIAEKVIGKLALDNTELIKTVVRQAIERTLGDRIVIKLNPLDHQNIDQLDPQFRESLDKTKRIAFRDDESIGQGGCIVESEVGTIDARLETQLNAIKKALSL